LPTIVEGVFPPSTRIVVFAHIPRVGHESTRGWGRGYRTTAEGKRRWGRLAQKRASVREPVPFKWSYHQLMRKVEGKTSQPFHNRGGAQVDKPFAAGGPGTAFPAPRPLGRSGGQAGRLRCPRQFRGTCLGSNTQGAKRRAASPSTGFTLASEDEGRDRRRQTDAWLLRQSCRVTNGGRLLHFLNGWNFVAGKVRVQIVQVRGANPGGRTLWPGIGQHFKFGGWAPGWAIHQGGTIH